MSDKTFSEGLALLEEKARMEQRYEDAEYYRGLITKISLDGDLLPTAICERMPPVILSEFRKTILISTPNGKVEIDNLYQTFFQSGRRIDKSSNLDLRIETPMVKIKPEPSPPPKNKKWYQQFDHKRKF